MRSGLEHASEDDLELFCLGRLPSLETEMLEEHLLVCPDCQDRHRETEDYIRALKTAAAELGRAKTSGSGRWTAGFLAWPKAAWGLAGAAVVAALLWLPAAGLLSRPASGVPVAVALQTFRGETPRTAVAPERRALVLKPEVGAMPLPPALEVQVVDASGRRVTQLAVRASGTEIPISLPEGLARGTYWVRLIGPAPGGELLQEYSLRVE